jgi:putative chitinase
MVRDSIEWLRVLAEVGVIPDTAARWADHFAQEIKEDTFSLGEQELPQFLAHFLHETTMLERMEESLNYSAGRIIEIGMNFKPGTRWRSAVPKAMELARNPRGFAEFMYGGRYGNDAPGDGYKYRGRGAGVTFKDNYRWLGNLLGVDLVADPDLLSKPQWALKAFIAYWENRVDDRTVNDVREVTLEVNGGDIGIKERKRLTALAQQVMVA